MLKRNPIHLNDANPFFSSLLSSFLLYSRIYSQGISGNCERGVWGEMEKSETSKSRLYSMHHWFSFSFFFVFTVQDFLDKAKKEFEENWTRNPKVSRHILKYILWDPWMALGKTITTLLLLEFRDYSDPGGGLHMVGFGWGVIRIIYSWPLFLAIPLQSVRVIALDIETD